MSVVMPPESAKWAVRRFDSPDIESVIREMPNWSMGWLQLTPSRGAHHVTAGLFGDLRFTATTTAGAFFVEGATPPDFLTMQFDRGSSTERVSGGKAIGADEILTAASGAGFGLRLAERHSGFNFSIPLSIASHALAIRAPGFPEPRSAMGLGIISGATGPIDRLRRMVDIMSDPPVGETLDGNSVALASAATVDTLMAALLAPWHRAEGGSWRPSRYQRLPVVQRAEAFMRASLGEPLMLHHICAAARAGERTVEYAFRDVYGVGAKHYLRLLRLDHVRRQLLRAEPDQTSVQAVARAAGFWHMGHFSTGYHRHFGEQPRQTLARRPPLRVSMLHHAHPAPSSSPGFPAGLRLNHGS